MNINLVKYSFVLLKHIFLTCITFRPQVPIPPLLPLLPQIHSPSISLPKEQNTKKGLSKRTKQDTTV